MSRRFLRHAARAISCRRSKATSTLAFRLPDAGHVLPTTCRRIIRSAIRHHPCARIPCRDIPGAPPTPPIADARRRPDLLAFRQFPHALSGRSSRKASSANTSTPGPGCRSTTTTPCSSYLWWHKGSASMARPRPPLRGGKAMGRPNHVYLPNTTDWLGRWRSLPTNRTTG